MSNIVAIVGRPNVGKSTLFNRLIGKRKAIVNEESGVTRDRNYGKSDWTGKEFSIIDTGGYVSNSSDIFEEEINKQVMLALDEADVILFVCDVELGITDLDQSFAKLLRKVDKPIYLVVNKVDNGERLYDAHEFYKLGIGEELFPISSASGSGTGDLLDKVVSHFSNNTIEETGTSSQDCDRRTTERGKIFHDQRLNRRRTQYRNRCSRNDKRYVSHPLQSFRA